LSCNKEDVETENEFNLEDFKPWIEAQVEDYIDVEDRLNYPIYTDMVYSIQQYEEDDIYFGKLNVYFKDNVIKKDIGGVIVTYYTGPEVDMHWEFEIELWYRRYFKETPKEEWDWDSFNDYITFRPVTNFQEIIE